MRRAALLVAAAVAIASPAAAQQRVRPMSLQPTVGAGYQPSDRDERGLWSILGRMQEELLASELIVRDPALTAYVEGVVKRIAGPAGADVKVVIIRDPSFNASMFPNGLMLVNTGLLLRMRNEAEMAGVLGHEVGHYVRRHQLVHWRQKLRGRGIAAFISVGLGIAGGALRANTYGTIRDINTSVYLGEFAFGREHELEADAMGLRLIAEANYQPTAMAAIWASQIEEERVSARVQGRRPREGASMLSSHPSNERRMVDLAASAAEFPPNEGDLGEERYRAALAPLLPSLLKDQVMLNDPGASLYILGRLAQGNWTGLLRYYEGEAFRLRDEDGDRQRAMNAYSAAVALPDAPAEAWRAHGYALIRGGQTESGRAALSRYLELAPEATDAPMVRQSIAQ